MLDTEHLKRTYFKMALPVVIGLVITLIYNLADTFFISMTENNQLIAGVSYIAPLFTLLMAFGNIFGQGGSSLVARLLGRNDTKSLKNISAFCFYGALIVGVLITAIMLVFQDAFLKILGASGDNLPYARDYYIWLVIGAPAIIASFVHGNFIRCEGYSTSVMIGHIVGTAINIILDPILILVFKMGAQGAAIATILGYLVSTIYFLILAIKKSKYVSVNPKDIPCELRHIGQIFGIGITVAITNIMQTVSNIILNRFLGPYGDDSIAAMGVVLKVSLISQLVLSGFSFGSIPVFGYLFGRGDKKKIKELTIFTIYLLGGISVGLTIVLGCFAEGICSVFFKDSAMIAMSATMLRWLSVSLIFMTMILIFTVLFQAGGKVVSAFVMSISRQGVVFIVLLLILNATAGYKGILATQAAADVVSFLIAIVAAVLSFKVFGNKNTHDHIDYASVENKEVE